MNTFQVTPVDLKLYNFDTDGARSNIWKGQYGIYQLSNISQKFDEDNQEFVDWPNVNITEGYDLGVIAPYFGKYYFTYEEDQDGYTFTIDGVNQEDMFVYLPYAG